MTEKELQESRKLFGQALAEALAEKYDEELKEAPDVKLPVDHHRDEAFGKGHLLYHNILGISKGGPK